MKPFLKWPGGKRWLTANHHKLFPGEFGTYFEPFLGSGALFFYLKPNRSVLSDVNAELIQTYNSIKNDWGSVLSVLELHNERHSKDYYYFIRKESPQCSIQAAARLIYLNRTCFNGIYRVNKQGRFNVPIGDRKNVLYDTDDFSAISNLLLGADIYCSDFEEIIDSSLIGDFVFADPPYTVCHNLNGFQKYNEVLFSWGDQVRLADVLKRAALRGVKILSTNANHERVREIYLDRGFSISKVSRYSAVSGKSGSRKPYEEIIITANL